MSLSDAPPWAFRLIRRGFDRLRETVFSKNVEERDADLHVTANIEEVRSVLGYMFFTNGWELSWHYKGEDLNMRRPLRKDDTYKWYQTHVRGWENDDGTCVLEVHEDLEPTEYLYKHLNPPDDATLSHGDAVETVSQILDEAGVDNRKV